MLNMTILKLLSSAALIATTLVYTAPKAYAQFMSMFNSAGMMAVNFSNTVGLNAAISHSANINTSPSSSPSESEALAPASTSEPYTPIPYSQDLTIRAEVIDVYVERVRQQDAQSAELLASLFSGSLGTDPAGRDLIGEFAQNARAYGLDINDLGDVITAYWAVSWGAVNQTGRPSVGQVQGLRTQIQAALAGSSLIDTTSLGDRQRMADDMMVNLLLVDGGIEESLRDGNVAQLQQLSAMVRQNNIDSMGIDLAQLDLTTEGLTLR